MPFLAFIGGSVLVAIAIAGVAYLLQNVSIKTANKD